jgi:H+-transporting ATPase
MIVLAGLFRRNPLLEMVQFALILAVASIPVALPAVLSVTMAVGAERLARLKAIVSRLVSIEEMAGMDTLCSDKTGTLTKNELTLRELEPAAGVEREDLILCAALAAQRDAPDAIDTAVLAGARQAGARVQAQLGAIASRLSVPSIQCRSAPRLTSSWTDVRSG